MSSIGQALTAVVGGVIGFIASGFNVTGALYGFELGLLAGSVAFPTKLPGTFGPKLTDGATTSATVGGAICRGYGTFSTAGTVIYLGVCKQFSTTTSQGSKGAPSQSQTTYSYTQSIGIGLVGVDVTGYATDTPMSGRLDILSRIWENGQLVYDGRPQLAGESDAAFATRSAAAATYADTFVLYTGEETQLADPTIEADVGIGNAPAFRGLGWIMYPNRSLRDDQGQRHPTFKFECTITDVLGDFEDGMISVSSIIQSVLVSCGYANATQLDTTTIDTRVQGYSLESVMTGRDALGPLRSVALFDCVESGTVLKFVKRGAAALRTLTTLDYGVYDDPSNATPDASISVTEQQEVDLPMQIRVSYISVDQDYQTSQQLSPARFDTDSVNITDVELAVAMSDDQAKQTAEILWNDAWQSKDTYTAIVDQSNADIEPADVLIVPMNGNDYRMRVTSINDASMIMRTLTMSVDDDGAYTSQAVADPPARPPPTVSVPQDTLLVILDIPALSETDSDAGFYVAAYGDPTIGNSWPGCALFKSSDGATFTNVAALTGSPPIGTLDADLPAGITGTWDDENYVDVVMVNGSEFVTRTESDVLAGANTIAVGHYSSTSSTWEILQFTTAVDMVSGSVQFTRLSHLLRGRRGTEQFVGTGVSGDHVIGLTMGNLFRIAGTLSSIGQSMTWRAVTIGKAIVAGNDQMFTPMGIALKPFFPVDATAVFDGSNNFVLSWIRRDRFGAPLTSGVAVVNSDTPESYSIDIIKAGAVIRTLASSTPTVTYTSANQVTDFGSIQTSYTVRIYQLSPSVGRGYKDEVTLP